MVIYMNSDNQITTALTVYSNREEKTSLKQTVSRASSRITDFFVQRAKLLFLYLVVSVFGLFVASVFSVYNHNLYYFVNDIISKYDVRLYFAIILFLTFVFSFSAISKAFNFVFCALISGFIGNILFHAFLGFNYSTLLLFVTVAIFFLLFFVFNTYCVAFSHELLYFQRNIKRYFTFSLSCAVQIYLLYLLFSLIINLFMLG